VETWKGADAGKGGGKATGCTTRQASWPSHERLLLKG